MIKFLAIALALTFSTLGYSSSYRAFAEVEFLKTFRIDNSERVITIHKKDSANLIFHDSSFNSSIKIDNLSEDVIQESVSLAKGNNDSGTLYLLFDCFSSEEIRMVFEVKNNLMTVVQGEKCKGL